MATGDACAGCWWCCGGQVQRTMHLRSSMTLHVLQSQALHSPLFFSSRRRHTRCYRDWSSDVYSSDLIEAPTPDSLTIRVEEDKEGRRRGGDRGWVRHEARLKLPKSVNLKISSVNGKVEVGAITGEVGVNSVNGGVVVAQAGTATQLSSINGGISVSLLRLGEGGLRVHSVNGGVKIGLPSETNAEIDVHSINGGINSDLPITVVGEVKYGQLRGRVGDGGPLITITSVNGGVTLQRN